MRPVQNVNDPRLAQVRVHDLEATLTFVLPPMEGEKKELRMMESHLNTQFHRIAFLHEIEIAHQNPCIPSSILPGN